MKARGLLCLMLSLGAMLDLWITVRPVLAQQGDVRIVTSFYPIYIAALNLCDDVPDVSVVNMTKPFTGCLHNYQLTPEDMVTLSRADILIFNGAGMESFLDKAVRQMQGKTSIDASKGIELIRTGGEMNAHVWVSVPLHMKQVQNIVEGLVAADPLHAEDYRKNGNAYLEKLRVLSEEMSEGLSDAQNRDIITFHEAFPYFAKEFGLNVRAVIEHEPGAAPSAGDLAKTIEIVRRYKVKSLFTEPQYPSRAAEIIARETGARVYTLNPVVTGPMTSDAYLEAMRCNLQVLKRALNSEQ